LTLVKTYKAKLYDYYISLVEISHKMFFILRHDYIIYLYNIILCQIGYEISKTKKFIILNLSFRSFDPMAAL